MQDLLDFVANVRIPAWLWQGAVIVFVGLIIEETIRRVFRFRRYLKRQAQELRELLTDISCQVNKLSQRVDEVEQNIEERAETWTTEVDALDERIQVILDATKIEADLAFRGRILYTEKRYDEARDILSSAIDSGTAPASARYYRGLCHLKLGKGFLAEAAADFEQAIRQENNHPDWYLTLASTLLRLQKWNDAESYANEAIACGVSNRSAAWSVIGKARFRIGSYDDALDAYSQCPPTYPAAAEGMGEVLIRQAEQVTVGSKAEYWQRAIDHYTQAISAAPKNSNYSLYKAMAHLKRGKAEDWERAMQDFDLAEGKSRGRDTKVFERRGDAWFDKAVGASDEESRAAALVEATENYVKGLKVAPASYSPVFRVKLSGVYQKLGQVDFALEHAKRAVEGNPNHVRNHLVLVTCLLWAGRWKEAKEAAQACIECARRFGSHNAGTIWGSFFRALSTVLGLESNQECAIECQSFIKERRSYPKFDPSMWDWAVAKHKVDKALEGTPSQKECINLLSKLLDAKFESGADEDPEFLKNVNKLLALFGSQQSDGVG